MPREIIAYALLAVLVAGIGVAIAIARRNSQAQRYRRASHRRSATRAHGKRP
ncbi:MAG TPA: hypothetical protein VFO80_01905 [Sphingomonas sp.]|nr:hypothetical protein [Sphingomonas sp.]